MNMSTSASNIRLFIYREMEPAAVVSINNDDVRRGYGSLGPFLRDGRFNPIPQFRRLSTDLHLLKLFLVILSLKLLSATLAP